ncbi:TPA: hypothetical protein OME29_004134 [Klebsiella oxytoca]|nr:hypothetical protein [Klebsiella oxytoca]
MFYIAIQCKDYYFSTGLSHIIQDTISHATHESVSITEKINHDTNVVFLEKDGIELFICNKKTRNILQNTRTVIVTDTKRINNLKRLPICFKHALIIDKNMSIYKLKHTILTLLKLDRPPPPLNIINICTLCVYRAPLTSMQLMVAKGLALGLGYRTIAHEIGVSDKSVRRTIGRLMSRYNFRNKRDLYKFIIRIFQNEF